MDGGVRLSSYSNSKPSVTLLRSPRRATALSSAPLRVTNDLEMELDAEEGNRFTKLIRNIL